MRANAPVALSPNYLLNKCKRKLGIKTFPLPMNDDELLEILYEDTLPTFSKFYPRYTTLKMNLNDLEPAEYVTDNLPAIQYGRRAYHIDISKYGKDLVILDIEDVKNIGNNYSDYISCEVGFQNGYDLFTAAAAQNQMESMLIAPVIFFFQAPDILVIDEPGIFNRNVVSITFLLVHAYDLSTVKMTYVDKLSSLFMIDLQISLYPLMKHMDKIDTPFGTIDLKIDSWENAEDKRKDLETDWESNFLSHRQTKLFRK